MVTPIQKRNTTSALNIEFHTSCTMVIQSIFSVHMISVRWGIQCTFMGNKVAGCSSTLPPGGVVPCQLCGRGEPSC